MKNSHRVALNAAVVILAALLAIGAIVLTTLLRL